MEFKIQQIGIIYSPYKTKDQCPIQGIAKPKGEGQIEIISEYQEALETIESFSHIILFYIFDRASEIKLSRPTFLGDKPHGLFASRHPCRPNGIGMSIVKLGKRLKNILIVSEIDVLDKTPLIDIKPYIPKFDNRENATNGWLENLEFKDKLKNRE
ncbi:tRNA (N6-threonylcarbamoyladenosine(37)-N6)-methyltransferase TrmO [candidate division KSB1 bacterium]